MSTADDAADQRRTDDDADPTGRHPSPTCRRRGAHD